jgi:hypothetical protein
VQFYASGHDAEALRARAREAITVPPEANGPLDLHLLWLVLDTADRSGAISLKMEKLFRLEDLVCSGIWWSGLTDSSAEKDAALDYGIALAAKAAGTRNWSIRKRKALSAEQHEAVESCVRRAVAEWRCVTAGLDLELRALVRERRLRACVTKLAAQRPRPWEIQVNPGRRSRPSGLAALRLAS